MRRNEKANGPEMEKKFVFSSEQFSGLICSPVSSRFVFKERSGVQLLDSPSPPVPRAPPVPRRRLTFNRSSSSDFPLRPEICSSHQTPQTRTQLCVASYKG
ncbi:hypothetical protein Trydic_g20987 [Trypoxylus dichotomus]